MIEITPLRRWRDRAMLTQLEVAEQLGISQSRYSEIEGGAICRLELALKINKMTGVPVEKLAGEAA